MLLRMFEKRLRGYRGIGYARGEAPLGIAPPQEPTIEYDEEPAAYAEQTPNRGFGRKRPAEPIPYVVEIRGIEPLTS